MWANYEYAWGGTHQNYYKEQSLNDYAIIKTDLQPIRFQGQFFDQETSLHYNRFRYYDSDVGMFISRDPIGLLGGLNTFQYAPNPIHWIDPYGLDCIQNKKDGTAREKRAKAILERHYGKDNVISEKILRDKDGKKVIDPLTLKGRRVDFIVKNQTVNGMQ
ncbi:MAG: RHS repeat-associated core domain-containing protein [Lonepinella koalarum]|nr:RHS repeat-associated core domain-containing protein [Lonepinella koalarum]